MIKVSKNCFQYYHKPFIICSYFYKGYFTKVPSDSSNLKKSFGQQQRHKPYSVKRETGEEKKLIETIAGSSSSSLTQYSLGQQGKSSKEMTIDLTEQELEICDALRKVTAYVKENKQISLELRIAGGWVRDKLLKLECHDIDVAINLSSGSEFANYVNEYLEKEGNDQIRIHSIKSNPERSKHLETATMNLCGLDIDFVNLRKETYEVSSRIPVVEYGTPEEDAHRRDMTINALFYNIHTNQVEDFTNRGMLDLKGRLIRTPLPADQTFMDDPLRVLRCIRFACKLSKFHFKIVEDVKNVIINNESIKEALNKKISRERVGVEVDKMIEGDPVHAIDLVVNLGYYDAVFSPPPQASGNPEDPKISLITTKILQWLLSDESKNHIHPIFHQLNENEKRALYLAAYVLPYKDMTYTEKRKSQPACQYVIRESMKFSTNDVEKVKKLLSSIGFIVNAVKKNDEVLIDRVELGLLIRELGSEWPTSLLFALSNELVPGFDKEINNKYTKNKYTKFIERIYELKLEHVYNEKPILDGKDVKNLLNIKSGPIIKEILESVMKWQLEYPNGSKEECQKFINHEYEKTQIFLT